MATGLPGGTGGSFTETVNAGDIATPQWAADVGATLNDLWAGKYVWISPASMQPDTVSGDWTLKLATGGRPYMEAAATNDILICPLPPVSYLSATNYEKITEIVVYVDVVGASSVSAKIYNVSPTGAPSLVNVVSSSGTGAQTITLTDELLPSSTSFPSLQIEAGQTGDLVYAVRVKIERAGT